MKINSAHKFSRQKYLSCEIKPLQIEVAKNVAFFKNQKDTDSVQLFNSLSNLSLTLERVEIIIEELEKLAREYDFSEDVHGNGFWTFIVNFNAAIRIVYKISKKITRNRSKYLFNRNAFNKKLELWNQIFDSLILICDELFLICDRSDKKCLYVPDNQWKTLDGLSKKIHTHAFYGTALSYNSCKSVRFYINFVMNSFVTYSKFHYSNTHKILKVLEFPVNFGSHLFRPERRARKFVKTSKRFDVSLCKNFWFLNEGKFFYLSGNAIAHRIQINKKIKIQTEPLQIFSEKYQKLIDIPIPSSHINHKPISCRLLSYYHHDGMLNKFSAKSKPKSRNLLFHVHGGGWASQTSASHEVYLKQWCDHIKCPILSIDYSLAPKAPFPRALEEIFYAYCWALKNLEYLGTTGEKIVFAGDSAGANLNTGLLVKCIEEGVPIPHGIVNIYGIFNVGFHVTPSALMTLMDPILPYIVTSCLIEAYAGIQDTSEKKVIENFDSNGNLIEQKESQAATSEKFNFKFHDSYYLSSYKAPDHLLEHFPPIKFVAGILDPLLDDSVQFGKRLKSLDVDVELDVLNGLYHGFLYFIQVSREARHASLLCAQRIKELFAEK